MNNDNKNFNPNTSGAPTPPPPPINDDLNNLPPIPQPQISTDPTGYTAVPQGVDNSTNIPPITPNMQPQQTQGVASQYQTAQASAYDDAAPIAINNDNNTSKKKIAIIGLAILALLVILIAIIVFFVTRNNNKPAVEEPVIEQTVREINLSEQSGDVSITESGEYTLSGNLTGAINIDAQDTVSLNLNSVQIESDNAPAINNQGSNDLNINLTDNSSNTINATYSESDGNQASAIYSAGTININGNGQLTVDAKDIDGIVANNISINNGVLSIYSDKNALTAQNIAEINGGDTVLEGKDYAIKTGSDYMINGGKLVALSVNNLEKPSANSMQQSLVVDFDKPIVAKELVSVANSDGEAEISFTAKSDFDKAVISSNEFSNGEHTLYQGGSNGNTASENGIYGSGDLSSGTPIVIKDSDKFTISSTGVTEVNNSLVVETTQTEIEAAPSTNNNTTSSGQGVIQAETMPGSGIPPKQ